MQEAADADDDDEEDDDDADNQDDDQAPETSESVKDKLVAALNGASRRNMGGITTAYLDACMK